MVVGWRAGTSGRLWPRLRRARNFNQPIVTAVEERGYPSRIMPEASRTRSCRRT
jgi:hypothetical protein